MVVVSSARLFLPFNDCSRHKLALPSFRMGLAWGSCELVCWQGRLGEYIDRRSMVLTQDLLSGTSQRSYVLRKKYRSFRAENQLN